MSQVIQFLFPDGILPLELVLLSLVLTLLFSVYRVFTRKPKSIPTLSIGLPFLGDALALGNDPVSFLRLATAKCGSIFRVNLLLKNVIFLQGSDMNRVYLDTKEEVWSFGGGMVGHLHGQRCSNSSNQLTTPCIHRASSSTKLSYQVILAT
jgi:hypothetical protein